MFRVVGLSGSLRPQSSNEQLSRAAVALVADIDVSVYAGIGNLPHFNPSLDADDPPAEVAAFRQMMGQADGVIIASPEYAHGIPGSLKNALDWLVSTTVLSDKPLLLISASPTAGEFVHAQLTEVLKTMSAPPLPQSIRTRGRQAFDAAGALVDDELRRQLQAGMDALVTAMGGARDRTPDEKDGML